MESFLNLCWVVLSAAALVVWVRQGKHARARQCPRLVALLCFLSLMFPVISVTDDLHPIAQAVEDSSKRTHKTVKAPTNSNCSSSPAVIISGPVIAPLASVAEWSRPAV